MRLQEVDSSVSSPPFPSAFSAAYRPFLQCHLQHSLADHEAFQALVQESQPRSQIQPQRSARRHGGAAHCQ